MGAILGLENMWLLKDERKLLLAYYLKMKEVDKEGWFKEYNLVKILKGRRVRKSVELLKDYFDGDTEAEPTSHNDQDKFNISVLKKGIKDYISCADRVKAANDRLAKREFIVTKPHSSERSVIGISLTLKGWDLAKKYDHWFTKTGEWWGEYKGQWIWVVVGYVVMFIVGYLVAILTSGGWQ